MAEKRDKLNKNDLSHDEIKDDSTSSEDTKRMMGEIVETRNQMGETIDAIQDRLSWPNLSEQISDRVNTAIDSAKGAVYEATIGKATTMLNEVSNTTVVKTVKRNPIPFGLIGLGAAMLAYKAYSTSGSTGSNKAPRGNGRANSQDPASEAGLLSKASLRANDALDKVSEKADYVYQEAGEMMSKAYDKAGEFGDQAKAVYDQYIDENPLAVGALALAVGAAVGLAIPSTQYEGQLLGDYRDDLLEKAQGTATQLLDKTKQVVSEQIESQTNH